jgi:hypothetical protein
MSFIEKLLKDNSHVHIHDDKRDFVEQTIRSLINDGRSMLHVVADFDFTLTVEGDERVRVRNFQDKIKKDH